MVQQIGRRGLAVLALAFAACGAIGAVATARSLAIPENVSPPTITGTAREGETLTAHNGTWTNNPTIFTYQWRRCATDGTACTNITGATKSTYTLTANDVLRTILVEVTAANTDGRRTETSEATDVVGSKNGPKNTARPTISGETRVGEELTVSNGSWTPTPTSYSYRWQRCDGGGENCLNIAGATGRTYGVRNVDIENRLRVLVTARTADGVSTAASVVTRIVEGNTTTVTTSTTVQGNRAPVIKIVSLRWFGRKLYGRFLICDDSPGRIGITARHNKARALPSSVRFSVQLRFACGTYTRSWVPPARFRTAGKLVVQLRASDSGHRLSRIASRAIRRR
jgi:hypothetical protein